MFTTRPPPILHHLLKRTTPPSALAVNTHTNHQRRQALHVRSEQSRLAPAPTPFVPDAETFLKLIGRSLSAHSSKFKSWSDLFTLTSPQLKALGIEEARQRRYLLRWRDKFRRGDFGVGGDLQHVHDGVGVVGLVDLPVTTATSAAEGEAAQTEPDQAVPTQGTATLTKSPNTRRRIVSLPHDTTSLPESVDPDLPPVAFLKGRVQIRGPRIELIKGSGGRLAKIRSQEGMWEHRRGHKVDGGERRRAQVRAKKFAAAKRAQE